MCYGFFKVDQAVQTGLQSRKHSPSDPFSTLPFLALELDNESSRASTTSCSWTSLADCTHDDVTLFTALQFFRIPIVASSTTRFLPESTWTTEVFPDGSFSSTSAEGNFSSIVFDQITGELALRV